MNLSVSEIFYSPQGEGARAGEMSVFVRLQGCSAKHACYASGVACDTEFESGREMEVGQVLDEVRKAGGSCRWIIWTGGEPLDQLTADVVAFFKDNGYQQAVETSGVKPMPYELALALDYVAISPKVAEHVLAKHFPWAASNNDPLRPVDELRYVRHSRQGVPQPGLVARSYYLSPHSDGNIINRENLRHVLDLIALHPQWRMSVQAHKQWRVL